MEAWKESIVLGLVEGLTEFLPVSSSAHLKIAESLLGITSTEGFHIMVQLGNCCEVLSGSV